MEPSSFSPPGGQGGPGQGQDLRGAQGAEGGGSRQAQEKNRSQNF